MSHDGIPEGDSRVGTAEVRRSARVSTVARLLDCDESQVRRLVRAGTLEAHRIGKRGLRIFLDSVTTYQEARAEPSAQPRVMTRQRRVVARSSHMAAVAQSYARAAYWNSENVKFFWIRRGVKIRVESNNHRFKRVGP